MSELLGGIAGIILSLALAYVPGLKDWYNAKSKAEKVQWMGVLLIASALLVFGAGCAKLWIVVACSQAGALELAKALLAALVANQSSFVAFVRPFQQKESVG